MNRVIIDTSAWIESFRANGDTAVKEAVKQLISEDRILLPGIIKTELLRGTKSKKEYTTLDNLLASLMYLSIEDKFWSHLSLFSFELIRDGITVPLTDAYIALAAIENKAMLLHCDSHFDVISGKTNLNIFKLP